jgi:hypothetical protein
LAPGKYYVAAFEMYRAPLDYDFLSKLAPDAAMVILAEGETRDLEIPLIGRARLEEELDKLP